MLTNIIIMFVCVFIMFCAYFRILHIRKNSTDPEFQKRLRSREKLVMVIGLSVIALNTFILFFNYGVLPPL